MAVTVPLLRYPGPSPDNYDPRGYYTSEELSVLDEFKSKVHDLLCENEEEKKWCDEMCLLRYLRANTFNLTNAYTQLSNTVQWRRTFQPERITPDMIVKESATGKIHINGFDNEGHPILILRDRHENSKDSKTQVMFLVFMLELTIKIMPSHIEKLILVIDKKGSSLRSTPSLSMVKEVLHILMNHYPERLHKAFLVDVPWLFWATYKIISPFIHPVTKRKIYLVSTSSLPKNQKPQIKPSSSSSSLGSPVSNSPTSSNTDVSSTEKVTELPTTHADMVDHIPFERLDVVFGGGLEWEWCHKDYWQEVETVWKEVYN